jgi:hypothetical protein
MTDQELRELVARIAKNQEKTDAQLAETDAQLARTDAQLTRTDAYLNKLGRKIERLAEMYGGVGNNQGKVAEEFFFNSLKARPSIAGMQFDLIQNNLSGSRRGIQDEFDIVLINDGHVFIIEVKYRAHPSDLDTLVTRKEASFRSLFPVYGNRHLHLGLASFSLDDSLKAAALARGVTVLQRRGELIETTSPGAQAA